VTTPDSQLTTAVADSGQPELSDDSTTATAPATDSQAGDHRTALLALQARVARLDATAAADVMLLAAVHEIELLVEALKDRAVRAVQATEVKNPAIAAALDVSPQNISKRWPRSKNDDHGDAGGGGTAATAATDPTAPAARKRRRSAPAVEHVEVRLTGMSVFKRTARLEVTRTD